MFLPTVILNQMRGGLRDLRVGERSGADLWSALCGTGERRIVPAAVGRRTNGDSEVVTPFALSYPYPAATDPGAFSARQRTLR